MRIAFLLGAGVSLPASVPSTALLIEAVFRVNEYFRHADERFYRRGPEDLGNRPWEVDLTLFSGFLESIKSRCLGQ
jgi:hypothetical protein